MEGLMSDTLAYFIIVTISQSPLRIHSLGNGFYEIIRNKKQLCNFCLKTIGEYLKYLRSFYQYFHLDKPKRIFTAIWGIFRLNIYC